MMQLHLISERGHFTYEPRLCTMHDQLTRHRGDYAKNSYIKLHLNYCIHGAS
jgi:hypothetical protein